MLIYLRRIDERLAGLEREFSLRMTALEARMGSLRSPVFWSRGSLCGAETRV